MVHKNKLLVCDSIVLLRLKFMGLIWNPGQTSEYINTIYKVYCHPNENKTWSRWDQYIDLLGPHYSKGNQKLELEWMWGKRQAMSDVNSPFYSFISFEETNRKTSLKQ